ncbi:FAS1 domain-containing protein [Artemisia annua]|uniref:FAS1 domain-containing protein n=1 Tax=Artemisia annua TaxID=35608 RepID=A0A2U1NGR2_ARTAN|nr:FAS1 domain-containing protein [Artemisia annua]
MATLLQFIIIIIFICSTTTTTISATPYLSPEQQQQQPPPSSPPYNISILLNTLGFHHISVTATTTTTINSSTSSTITIFSPTDTSLQSCPYCSLPLLLLEHTVPGLYPYHLLKTLPFGAKIQTLATSSSNSPLCLTLTKTVTTDDNNNPTLFVGGVQITRPDIYNDGHVIVHGIQGYLAHLSVYSCQVEKMTSLSFPSRPTAIMRGFVKDAIVRLRMSDYTVLALLIQENVDQLTEMDSMTVFAVDDAGVFGDGHLFAANLKFHIVPNMRLTALELLNLPVDTVLPTMVAGEGVVVTVAGGGGPLTPMRINNVKVTSMNVVINDGIVVHGIAAPLPRVRRTSIGFWPDDDPMVGIHLGPTATSDY